IWVARHLRERGHGVAGDESQHARGRAHVRARRLHCGRAHRRGWHPRRRCRDVRTRRPRVGVPATCRQRHGPGGLTTMSWLRIKTVVRRHWYVLWRSPNRWFDIAVWPVFDVLLFGSLGAFVAQENDASRAAAPYLLAGIMLFHVLFQCQIAVTTGFMEETWSRNLLNIMTKTTACTSSIGSRSRCS